MTKADSACILQRIKHQGLSAVRRRTQILNSLEFANDNNNLGSTERLRLQRGFSTLL
jgi:hypothetical protein